MNIDDQVQDKRKRKKRDQGGRYLQRGNERRRNGTRCKYGDRCERDPLRGTRGPRTRCLASGVAIVGARGRGALNRSVRYKTMNATTQRLDQGTRCRYTQEEFKIDPEQRRPTAVELETCPDPRKALETRGTWNRNDSGAAGPTVPQAHREPLQQRDGDGRRVGG
jgi:hypothetical protein